MHVSVDSPKYFYRQSRALGYHTSIRPKTCRLTGLLDGPDLRLRLRSYWFNPMQVGWPARQPGKLETALANSFLVSSVVLRHVGADGAPAEERLIGLARCTSDHVFNATIWDVLVDPEFQVRKLG